MILDDLVSADRYAGLHPGFAQGFETLRRTDLASLPHGKLQIDGDRLFVIIARDQPKGDAARLESHRRYIDIQYVVEGVDRIGWRPTPCLTVVEPYSVERDIAFYSDAPQVWMDLVPGRFAIFYPEDAHAPLAGSTPPLKAVVKVAVDW